MLANATPCAYDNSAGAKSSADLGRSESQRRTSATIIAGAFFMPASYGGCAWDAFERAGFLCDRSANPRTVAPIRCLAASGDGSKHKGASPMALLRLSNVITRSLSGRAAAHRAMAKAALFADSSASTRLKRYNHHIEKAQQLEARLADTAKHSAGGVV